VFTHRVTSETVERSCSYSIVLQVARQACERDMENRTDVSDG